MEAAFDNLSRFNKPNKPNEPSKPSKLNELKLAQRNPVQVKPPTLEDSRLSSAKADTKMLDFCISRAISHTSRSAGVKRSLTSFLGH